MYSGRLVWMILGLGLFILSVSSSSSSCSLSHTCTTTLGVVAVAACSSYFSPGERAARVTRARGEGRAQGQVSGRRGLASAQGTGTRLGQAWLPDRRSHEQGLRLPCGASCPHGRRLHPQKAGRCLGSAAVSLGGWNCLKGTRASAGGELPGGSAGHGQPGPRCS